MWEINQTTTSYFNTHWKSHISEALCRFCEQQTCSTLLDTFPWLPHKLTQNCFLWQRLLPEASNSPLCFYKRMWYLGDGEAGWGGHFPKGALGTASWTSPSHYDRVIGLSWNLKGRWLSATGFPSGDHAAPFRRHQWRLLIPAKSRKEGIFEWPGTVSMVWDLTDHWPCLLLS